MGKDGHELLAPVAPEGIRRAERIAQELGHLAQHGVARGMAVLVVDALEVVGVDHEHVKAFW